RGARERGQERSADGARPLLRQRVRARPPANARRGVAPACPLLHAAPSFARAASEAVRALRRASGIRLSAEPVAGRLPWRHAHLGGSPAGGGDAPARSRPARLGAAGQRSPLLL